MTETQIFRRLGRKGGRATAKKYGPDHFRTLGKKSAAARKKLLRRGPARSRAD